MFSIIGMKPPSERILEPQDYSFELERTTRSYAALLRGGMLGRPPEPPEPPPESVTDHPEELDDDAFYGEASKVASEDQSIGVVFRSWSVPYPSSVEREDSRERLVRSMSVAEGEKRKGYRLHRIDVDLRERGRFVNELVLNVVNSNS
jgi:hypothetical protein